VLTVFDFLIAVLKVDEFSPIKKLRAENQQEKEKAPPFGGIPPIYFFVSRFSLLLLTSFLPPL
jgi:hypothetical protein